MMLSYKGWLVFSQPLFLLVAVWNRRCGDRNCSRQATVPLGIDTLIANILVSNALIHCPVGCLAVCFVLCTGIRIINEY